VRDKSAGSDARAKWPSAIFQQRGDKSRNPQHETRNKTEKSKFSDGVLCNTHCTSAMESSGWELMLRTTSTSRAS
jgi:hypothetical protein